MEKKPVKNFGLITEAEFVGRPLNEAITKAENDGLTTRIVELDGHPYMLQMDYKTNRINFRVNNGLVVAAYGG